MTKKTYVESSRGRLIVDGLIFDKEKHEYLYRGHELSGVTGIIAKKQKKNYSSGHVEECRQQGSHIHDVIETFLTTGMLSSVHPDALWALDELQGLIDAGHNLYSEVLVSDFNKFASAVDVLSIVRPGELYLFDTKAGVFGRESVTWQLSIYKYFLESTTDFKVKRLFCLSTRHHDIYPVIPRDEADVKGLLYGSRK